MDACDRTVPEMKQEKATRAAAALLVLIVLFSTGLRLGTLRRPLVGNFATKNVVYAMTARNWVLGKTSLWYPTLDMMRDGRRSLHMMEFPLSVYAAGAAWNRFGGSLDVWGRVASIVSMAAATGILFLFVRRRHGATAALASAAVLAFAPLGILYGCAFILQPSLVLFSVAAFWGMDRWMCSGRAAWWAITLLATAAMILTKVYAGVLLLPLGWTALFEFHPCAARRRVLGLLGLGLAILPPALWYSHAYRTAAPENPEAARVFYSVRHGGKEHLPPHPILRNADYYRRILDDLSGIVLTPIGFTLAVLAVFHPSIRRYAPWLAACGVLLILLPRKFYEMDYYYMIGLPLGAVLAGLGWRTVDQALRRHAAARLPGMVFVFAVFLVLSLRYAAKPTYAIPEEDRAVVEAGAAAQRLSRPEEPILTRHGSGCALLYYCDRPGWILSGDDEDLPETLQEYADGGVRLLVVAGPDTATVRSLLPNLTPLEEGSAYVLYEITGTPPAR